MDSLILFAPQMTGAQAQLLGGFFLREPLDKAGGENLIKQIALGGLRIPRTAFQAINFRDDFRAQRIQALGWIKLKDWIKMRLRQINRIIQIIQNVLQFYLEFSKTKPGMNLSLICPMPGLVAPTGLS